jgi:hypothetical protein
MTTLNGLPGIETPEFLLCKIDEFAPRTRTTSMRSVRTGCVRRTSGPSRWRRIGAVPATAPSSTGPRLRR